MQMPHEHTTEYSIINNCQESEVQTTMSDPNMAARPVGKAWYKQLSEGEGMSSVSCALNNIPRENTLRQCFSTMRQSLCGENNPFTGSPKTMGNTDIYIVIHNSSNIAVMKQQQR